MNSKQESIKKYAVDLMSKRADSDEGEKIIKLIDTITPNPIHAINPDYTIRYVNSAFEKMTGFSSKELIGIKPPYPYWLKGQYRRNRMGIKNALNKGGKKAEWQFRRKDGKRFWVEITDRPLIINGERKFSISQWVEITDRKRMADKLKRYNRQLRAFSAHLASLVEDERGRISREIHDGLGQDLTALIIDLHWLERNLDKDKALVINKLDTMIENVELTIETAKRLYTELRPTILDDLGIAAAFEWQVREFQKSTGIICHLDVNLEEITPNRTISTVLFRALQQTLVNVYRHAEATKIDIELKYWRNKVCLLVHDNGKGIAQEEVRNPKSFGLIGMRERVNYLGGSFKIIGVSGKGTTISITIPSK